MSEGLCALAALKTENVHFLGWCACAAFYGYAPGRWPLPWEIL